MLKPARPVLRPCKEEKGWCHLSRKILLAASLIVALVAVSCRQSPTPAPLKVEVNITQVSPSQTPVPARPMLPGQPVSVGAAEVVLGFHFAEAMDQASTSAAILVKPQVAKELRWTGPDSLQVYLSDLPLGTPISVTLDTGARSLRGAQPPLPLTYTVQRVDPPLVTVVVEGQPDISAPGNYKVLPGKKTLRIEFSRPMDTAAVEAALLGAIPPLSQPTLRWENDRLAYLDLDLPVDTSISISFAGLPDRAGIVTSEAGRLLLMGVGTVRLLAGSQLDRPLPIATLLDQFEAGFASPDGRLVAFLERFWVDESSQVNVWVMDVQSKALQRRASYTDTGTFSVAWMPDSARLVVATGHDLVLLPARQGEPRSLYHCDDRVFVGMSVAPRSGRIACFLPVEAKEGSSVDLLIYDPHTGETKTYPSVTHLQARESHWIPVANAWSPDEEYIAFSENQARGKQTLTLIDPEKGATRLLGGPATALAWSPDGRYLAVRSPEGAWDLLETTTGERKPVLPGETFPLLFWSPDARRLLLGHPDKAMPLATWDVREGSTVRALSTGIPVGWSRDRALWLAPPG